MLTLRWCRSAIIGRIRPILNSLAKRPEYQLITISEELDRHHLFQTCTLIKLPNMTISTALSQDKIQFFVENGFIVLKNVFTPTETKELQEWAQVVHDLPRTSEVPWMPYEVNHFSMALPWART